MLAAFILVAILWSSSRTVGSERVAGAPTAGAMPVLAPRPALLPPEARRALVQIAAGGPFPQRQDGAVFGSDEGRLPSQPRGDYHKQAMKAPNAGNRGARRIIAGGTPAFFYQSTGGHYRSFQAFEARS